MKYKSQPKQKPTPHMQKGLLIKLKKKQKMLKIRLWTPQKKLQERQKTPLLPTHHHNLPNYQPQTHKDGQYEEGGPETEIGRGDKPLTEYREKEAMTPAKINEHNLLQEKQKGQKNCIF